MSDIDIQFSKFMQARQKQSEETAKGLTTSVAYDWDRPGSGPAPDPYNPGTIAEFARDSISGQYQQTMSGSGGGTVGDRAATKLQHDHLAMAERAWRARHCSPVACFARSAARLTGHGENDGVYTGGILKGIQNLLKSSKSSSPPTPTPPAATNTNSGSRNGLLAIVAPRAR